MENFDLKKFLVENKITTNSKVLKEEKNSDDKKIEDWVWTLPLKDMDVDEHDDLTKKYTKEWNSSKEKYKSIGEFLRAAKKRDGSKLRQIAEGVLDLENPTEESLAKMTDWLEANPEWAVDRLVAIFAGGGMHMADIAADTFEDLKSLIEGKPGDRNY
jgi:hypothetical protein